MMGETQKKSGYLYGCKGMVVKPLLENGAEDPTGVVVGIKTAQKAEVELTYVEGEESSLRGGDVVCAVIKEPDKISGASFKFTNAKFDAHATLIISGGKLIEDDTDPEDVEIIGWEAPKMADGSPPPFHAELYVTNYSASGIMDGYVRITLPYCTGRISALSYADKEWSTPEFQINSKENTELDIACYRKEFVAALPAELQ